MHMKFFKRSFPTGRASARHAIIGLIAVALLATACSSTSTSTSEGAGPDGEAAPTTGTPGSDGSTTTGSGISGEFRTVSIGGGSDTPGITIELRPGAESVGDVSPPPPPVDGTALSDTEVDEIISRLPGLPLDPADQVDFNRPVDTRLPPQSSTTIDNEFPLPPTDTAPAVVDGPLEVLRFQPEGFVDIAPFISITFSQPMVPIGTLQQLDTLDIPVVVSPEIPGRWQWIGTKTLRFEADLALADDQLPKATSYVVTIPADTTSATGNAMAEPVEFTFETPTAQITSFSPTRSNSGQGGLPLDQVFMMRFNQRIEGDAILAITTMTVNGTAAAIRPATTTEVEDAELIELLEGPGIDGRWVAFRAVDELSNGDELVFTVGPNMPSAEGPLLNPETASYDAFTYRPLEITDAGCGGECRPFSDLWITFNNDLDRSAFDAATITIDPALDFRTAVTGNSIRLSGTVQGRTTYTVTVPADVADIYGQTLGEAQDLEFQIGAAEPALVPFPIQFITLDPLAGNPGVSVSTINHDELRVRVFSVDEAQWDQYEQFRNDWEAPVPDWTELSSQVLPVSGPPDNLIETRVPLDDQIAAGHSQMVVYVEPMGRFADLDQNDELYWQNRPQAIWVQSTTIGIDAFADGTEMVVWTTDLRDGTPLGDVSIRSGTSREAQGSISGTTDSDGILRLELDTTNIRNLIATSEDDVAILANWWSGYNRDSSASWFIFDDRQIYKPGETVSIKGWVRDWNQAGDAQLGLVGDGAMINWQVSDSFGNEIGAGDTSASGLGGFDFSFDVPLDASLGRAWINLSLSGADVSGGTGHEFSIQEFRRPEFEVTTQNETAGPYLVGESATVSVNAKYFAGGTLPNADVSWRVTSQNTNYEPPNRDDWIFGEWIPWWFSDGFARGFSDFGGEVFGDFPGAEGQEPQRFAGLTDAAGNHYLELDFGPGESPSPVTVSATADVQDVNRQTWSSTTSLLVHPADVYVGLRSVRTFVRQGEPLIIDVLGVDIEGEATSGQPITVLAERLEWGVGEDGTWGEQVIDSQQCLLTSDGEVQSCTFQTERGGEVRITAAITDALGRTNKTVMQRWVSGGQRIPALQVEQEAITIIPDKEEYLPGETAELLIDPPFAPAHGQLIISRAGIESITSFEVGEEGTILEVPVSDDDIPNLNVRVELVGATPRTDAAGQELTKIPPRPAFASGALTLKISKASRTLTLQAVPQDDVIAPGSDTSVEVEVRNAAGQPVADAEVAIVVVDEAVLALSNYQLADPIETFYTPFFDQLNATYGRQSIILTDPQSLLDRARDSVGGSLDESAMASEAMADGDFAAPQAAGFNAKAVGAQGGDPITVRENFDALATFSPAVTTNSDGLATVTYTLPDNLTRYRVMVVAAAGDDQFGSVESNLTARLPLMVRPSAPRFLNFGDEFELPVVIQNQTSSPLDVDVVLQATNLELTDRRGTRVTVPANDRVEVRFPAKAVEAGTVRFQAAGVSGDLTDAATVSLPVYTPATTEAFATYGVVDAGAIVQPILAPTDVFPQFGALEVTTSSTAVQALTDAVLYLHDYRYASADGLSSRIASISALDDVLLAFQAEGVPTPAELRDRVQQDIASLVDLQNFDGGFSYWQRGRPSEPYVSLHAAHALVEAKKSGYDVPEDTLQRSLEYARNIDSYTNDYTEITRATLAAYALYIRDLNGERDSGAAADVWRRFGDDVSLEAAAWLWPVIDDTSISNDIERLFNNRVTETAGAATFATDYGEEAYLLLHSDRRTDGIVLEALISQRPDSDLIPKTVKGLLADQTKGRWNNSQENTFILLALNRYFLAFEGQTPDFVARVWLGDIYAAEHEYVGRSTDSNETLVPMAELIDQGDANLVLSKEGDGRLYYRLGVTYAPEDLVLDPLDRGFVVQRSYEAVDDPDDVIRDDDGVWHIRAGAEVRVRLTMINDSRRTHVALIDPLPAGLEAVNPALAVSSVEPDPVRGENTWWWGAWYGHQNLKDDRVEAFTTYLWAGTWNYSYVARATTPGRFITPPTKAEEIFAPEVFGRTSSDIVIIE